MSEESETTAGGDGVIEEQRRERAWLEGTDLPRPALTQEESLARLRNLPPPAPLERSTGGSVSAVGPNSSCGLTSGSGPGTATYAVLERRLQKAIIANTKWQQKYEIETK
ncbi:unnamed protein product, partial [Ectocarpus sp. 12 AP-2014]